MGTAISHSKRQRRSNLYAEKFVQCMQHKFLYELIRYFKRKEKQKEEKQQQQNITNENLLKRAPALNMMCVSICSSLYLALPVARTNTSWHFACVQFEQSSIFFHLVRCATISFRSANLWCAKKQNEQKMHTYTRTNDIYCVQHNTRRSCVSSFHISNWNPQCVESSPIGTCTNIVSNT